MGRLKNGPAGDVVDVGARSDADAPHLGSQGVGYVVAVEVHGRHHVILGRPGQDLLQKSVGNDVLDDDFATVHRFALGVIGGRLAQSTFNAVMLKPGKYMVAELLLGHIVGPVFKAPFRELHDVAFMHQRHAFALLLNGIFQGGHNEPLSAFTGNGFEPNGTGIREANLGKTVRELCLEQLQEPVAVLAAIFKFNAGIDIFRVFPEDDHIDKVRLLHRRRDSGKPPNRTQADIQIELLPQGHINGPDATAHGCCERTFYGNEMVFYGGQRFIRQPAVFTINFVRLFASVNLHPRYFPLAAICLFNGRIQHLDRGAPDIRTGAVTLDKWHQGMVGNGQPGGILGDLFALFGRTNMLIGTHRRALLGAAGLIGRLRAG